MSVRTAVVAGQFYEASAKACRDHIEHMLAQRPLPQDIPDRVLAGVVPHAGWTFSGDLAAMVFAAIKAQQNIDTFVIFGAVHSVTSPQAMLYSSGQWATPLGPVDVDAELGQAILARAGKLMNDDSASHSREHSIEVQIPIIRHLFEDARIVPIMVPPTAHAHEVGEATAAAIAEYDKSVMCIASTDLTHYGPSYRYAPMGEGPKALEWVKDQNDRYFIDMAMSMRADTLVESSQMYHNACGAGAVAATVAAAEKLGAKAGHLLAHTTSAEVMARQFGRESDDAVGYAAILFA